MKKRGVLLIIMGIVMIVMGIIALFDSTISIGGQTVTLELAIYLMIGFSISGVAMIITGTSLLDEPPVVVLDKKEETPAFKYTNVEAAKDAKRRYEESMKGKVN